MSQPVPVADYMPQDNGSKIVIAYVIWFFLGYLGIHMFFLGNNKRGFQYLGVVGVTIVLSVLSALVALMGGAALGAILFAIVGIACVLMFVMWVVDLFTIPRVARGIY